MLQTRSSKRLAVKQNISSTAKSKISIKCKEAFINQIVKESKINLNRACKKILQKNILTEKDKVCDETSANKKVSTKSTTKSSMRLMENKLKKNESKRLNKALTSKRNVQVNKENNSPPNQISPTIPLNAFGKTKIESTKKITNYFPLKTISDNAICRVPIWAVSKNPPQKQTKKRYRASDIYNIDKDEDLMNESPFKKKKMKSVKPRAIKNKVFSKKNIASLKSHKDKFLPVKAKPGGQYTKLKGLTVNSDEIERLQTNPTKPIKHPLEKYETSRSISDLMPIDPVPAPVDPVLKSVSSNALKIAEIPVSVNGIVTGSNPEAGEKEEGDVENCINDCYFSFANIDTSYISLRQSVAKCLGQSSNDKMTPEKCSKRDQVKITDCVEDCINECYSSFVNLDISLRESVKKNQVKLRRGDKTPEKYPYTHETNSEVGKVSNNFHDVQMFLIPKMTSTPEDRDHPIIHPVKQLSKNCGLKFSEMSAIPCNVSRNIQFELSEYEISPIKPASDNQKTPLLGSPFKENKSPQDEICISRKITGTSELKENTVMKVREKNPRVKCSMIPTISEKRVYMKTKENKKSIEALLPKENTENAFLPRLRHRRKGPLSPLKQIQVDSVSNKIPLSVDERQVALPHHMGNKNLEKVLPKHTQSRKVAAKNIDNITDSGNKNVMEKSDLNIHQIGLFESPEKKEEVAIEKSPVKKVRKNIFTEETASSLIEDDHLFKVLKPVKCYQSPHQAKKCKPRTKTALDGHRKAENDKEADHQPKKLLPRTKKAIREKLQAKEENEEEGNVEEIEKLNQHFSDLDKMDLCIE